MLTIDVYAPGSVRLTVGEPAAEIWLDPAGGHTARHLPKLILASRGQAMDGITAFMEVRPPDTSVQLMGNATLATAYPHLNMTAMGVGNTWTGHVGQTPVSVTMVSAASDSVLPAGQSGGLACGYMVQVAGHKIYLAAHTGVFGELRFIGDFYKPTIAVLPLDNQLGISLSDLPRVLAWIGADMFIPWPLSADIDPDVVRETVDAYTSAFCKLLRPGMSWELPEALSSGRSSGPESRY